MRHVLHRAKLPLQAREGRGLMQPDGLEREVRVALAIANFVDEATPPFAQARKNLEAPVPEHPSDVDMHAPPHPNRPLCIMHRLARGYSRPDVRAPTSVLEWVTWSEAHTSQDSHWERCNGPFVGAMRSLGRIQVGTYVWGPHVVRQNWRMVTRCAGTCDVASLRCRVARRGKAPGAGEVLPRACNCKPADPPEASFPPAAPESANGVPGSDVRLASVATSMPASVASPATARPPSVSPPPSTIAPASVPASPMLVNIGP